MVLQVCSFNCPSLCVGPFPSVPPSLFCSRFSWLSLSSFFPPSLFSFISFTCRPIHEMLSPSLRHVFVTCCMLAGGFLRKCAQPRRDSIVLCCRFFMNPVNSSVDVCHLASYCFGELLDARNPLRFPSFLILSSNSFRVFPLW